MSKSANCRRALDAPGEQFTHIKADRLPTPRPQRIALPPDALRKLVQAVKPEFRFVDRKGLTFFILNVPLEFVADESDHAKSTTTNDQSKWPMSEPL